MAMPIKATEKEMINTEKKWHTFNGATVLKEVQSSDQGLTSNEAKTRLERFGPNELPEKKQDGLVKIFARQFQSSLIYLLLASAAILFFLGESIDATIISVVIIFNAIVGGIQEGRAQNTLKALNKFVKTNATVVRDQEELIISASEVVLGDIVILSEGDKVPADLRVLRAEGLKTQEAALTGESQSVDKTIEPINAPDLPTPEHTNLAFKGTVVVAGSGRAVVVATGLNTVIGKITEKIVEGQTEIPLKANIRALSSLIIVVVAVVSVLLFSLGIVMGVEAREMFGIIIGLAVSIIPEGLPIVMTLVLATGVWRMTKHNALVKQMQAVEALGQARIIAVDKTGTITKNELVVTKLFMGGDNYDIEGQGYEPRGEIKLNGEAIHPLNHPELLLAGRIGAMASVGRVAYSDREKKWQVFGDPTEAAITVFSSKLGFKKSDLEKEWPNISEIPFNYHTKYRATLHKKNGINLMAVAGAPEMLLSLTKYVRWHGKLIRLDDVLDRTLKKKFADMSDDGLRVIGFAEKEINEENLNLGSVNELTLLGFWGLKDTIRPSVKNALAKAEQAGMRVVMITGDHMLTAKAIAREVGIYKEHDQVISGYDMETMSDDDLVGMIGKVTVFARVTPEHKLRIIKLFRVRKEIIAMTGDGVNDAPSLVAADLGVAMGTIGTEVAKEAADIILLDDNFGSIVDAIEEGRGIYQTIRKVILYLFSTSLGEVLVIASAMILGYPVPLAAGQIVWLNLVTDGFLDVALGMEPRQEGLLRQKFEKPKKYIINSIMARRMFLMASVMAVGTLAVYISYLASQPTKASTMALTVLAAFQWFNAWNVRDEYQSMFNKRFFSNKYLNGALILIVFLQIAAIYVPFMQNILRTVPLDARDWIIVIAIGLVIVVVEEMRKLFTRTVFRLDHSSLKPASENLKN